MAVGVLIVQDIVAVVFIAVEAVMTAMLLLAVYLMRGQEAPSETV